jgi:hypothetical protein
VKIKKKKELYFDLTLDSSETTMFNQGGKHSLDFKEVLSEEDIDLDEYDKIEISFQLERNEQGRFNFINNEAARHRKEWDEMNAAKPQT